MRKVWNKMRKINRRGGKRVYIWLVMIYTAAHFLLCFISGQWWDDWCYWINGTEILKTVCLEGGRPLQFYNMLSALWLPNWGYRVVVFFLFLIVGLLFFSILRNVNFISEEDAFWVSAVAMTVPVNDARALLNCYIYSLELPLFMISFYIITKIERYSGGKKIVLRILSLVCLLYSYATESLLVFTGLIWLYFFYNIWIQNVNEKLGYKVRVFFKSYWDYFILPFIFYIVKRCVFKPYGRYEGYNNVTVKSLIRGTVFSPFAALKTGIHMVQSYLFQIGIASIIVLMIVVIIYLLLEIIRRSNVTERKQPTIKKRMIFLFIGFVVYYAGIFPYIIVRGGTAISTTGVDGRDAMLAGFGIGMIIVAFCRMLPVKRPIQNLLPITLIILGIFHFNDWYLNYQEDWYHQQEFANAIAEIDGFDDDNTILCDFSTVSPNASTRFYSLNGMSYTVTGKMDKFFFSGIYDLRYGIEFNEYFLDGYNANDYDSSDMTIDGILVINNAPISNIRLLKMRFNEIFRFDVFECEIKNLTDAKYVRIEKATSNRIYEFYQNGELSSEVLQSMILADN